MKIIKWIKDKLSKYCIEICVLTVGTVWLFSIHQSMSLECEKAKLDISQALLTEIKSDSK